MVSHSGQVFRVKLMLNRCCWEVLLKWTPHPVIVTARDYRDYVRVLLYSCYTTIKRWGGGVLLKYWAQIA